ncbi:hypothetical protein Strvi_1130 [Streptomyces violaceusniger Tu 4113]|uniref:Uncharacterized protein n=1 Tax=Streptomyces violaceusniger (strain Tu 4113) TaxID=653045 RepID=G2P0D1_STRV4|nr:hypothetical protein Strvi_1130 [Streptomyces violaceusniger Tu 4113]
MSQEPALMTVRVSRNGGKTFGPMAIYRASNASLEPLKSSAWPPCECPRCASSPDARRLQAALARLLGES